MTTHNRATVVGHSRPMFHGTARKRIVVTASDLTGGYASGRGLRALGIAAALSAHHDVSLLCNGPPDFPIMPPGVAVVGPSQRRDAIATADVIVTGNELNWRELLSLRAMLVADLYDPLIFQLPYMDVPLSDFTARANDELSIAHFAISHADLILCANEPQRDLYIGARLAAWHRWGEAMALPPGPDSSGGVLVLPNGIPTEAPRPCANLRAQLGVAPDDILLIWGGGVWGFLDPELAVTATVCASTANPRVRLLFLGLSRDAKLTPREARLLHACNRAGASIIMNPRWVPLSVRGSYLAASTAGVIAQQNGLETHFAFRTRLIDCIWAELPVVATGGDSLTAVGARQGWALVSPSNNPDALAHSMLQMADIEKYEAMRAAIRQVRPSWTWDALIQPLLAAIEQASPPQLDHRMRRSISAAAREVRSRARSTWGRASGSGPTRPQ